MRPKLNEDGTQFLVGGLGVISGRQSGCLQPVAEGTEYPMHGLRTDAPMSINVPLGERGSPESGGDPLQFLYEVFPIKPLDNEINF